MPIVQFDWEERGLLMCWMINVSILSFEFDWLFVLFGGN